MKTSPQLETTLYATNSAPIIDRHQQIDLIRGKISEISEEVRTNPDKYRNKLAKKRAAHKIKRLARALYGVDGVSELEKVLPIAEAAGATHDQQLIAIADKAIESAFPISGQMSPLQRSANEAMRKDFSSAITDTNEDTPFAAALLRNESTDESDADMLRALEQKKVQEAREKHEQYAEEHNGTDEEGTVRITPEEMFMLEDDDEFDIPELHDKNHGNNSSAA